MREVVEEGCGAHAIGDPLRFDQSCRRRRVPDVLENYGAAQHQRGQHAEQIAELMRERRRGEADVAAVRPIRAAKGMTLANIVFAVCMHPFGSPVVPDVKISCIRSSGAAVLNTVACRSASRPVEEVPCEGALGGPDREDMPQCRHLRRNLVRHRLEIETAEPLRHDEHRAPRKPRHENELPMSQHRHDGVGHGPDPDAAKDDCKEFPPVRQLERDDVPSRIPRCMQSEGNTIGRGCEFAVGNTDDLAVTAG